MPAVQARAFCCTSFTKIDDYFNQEYWEQFRDYFNFVAVGKETCPQTGRPHIHIYLETKTRRSIGGIKKILHDPDLHVELRMGNAYQAIDYTMKSGVCWKMGEIMRPGRRTDLDGIRELIDNGGDLLDVADQHFGDFVRYHRGISLYIDLVRRRQQRDAERVAPEVIVYIGAAGSGKSWHCANDEDYKDDGYQLLLQQNGKVYFDGYEKQKVIWMDEFTGSTLPFTTFCRIADKYGCRVETKGGSVEIIGLKKILISTIEPPKYWWAGSDRFNRDPKQLYRRISKLFFIPPADDDVFYRPIEINKRDGSYDFVDEVYLSEIQKNKEPY